jgi:hypothetical protein
MRTTVQLVGEDPGPRNLVREIEQLETVEKARLQQGNAAGEWELQVESDEWLGLEGERLAEDYLADLAIRHQSRVRAIRFV